MNNDKTQLQELVGYLPWGTKFISELDKPYDEYGKQPIWTLNGITEMFGDNCLMTLESSDAYPMHLCKPLLYPLEYLTKEIEHNGEKFIPIEQLDNFHNFSTMRYDEIENDPTPYPFTIVQKLYEWHFDVHNLIGRGLAIDKTTLNQ